MMLMFWSATHGSMPASRSSASTNEMRDEVVGAEEFFHARWYDVGGWWQFLPDAPPAPGCLVTGRPYP